VSQELQVPRDHRVLPVRLDPPDRRVIRALRVLPALLVHRVIRAHQVSQVLQVPKVIKDHLESQVLKAHLESQVQPDRRVPPESRVPKVLPELQALQALKVIKGHLVSQAL